MFRSLAAALLFVTAPLASHAAVTVEEGVTAGYTNDFSATASDTVIGLGLGNNIISGSLTVCPSGIRVFCRGDRVDAFQASLAAQHVITDVVFGNSASISYNEDSSFDPVGKPGPGMFDFIMKSAFDFACPAVPDGVEDNCNPVEVPWKVTIQVSQVPLPATGLLALGGIAALGAVSRRRRRSAA